MTEMDVRDKADRRVKDISGTLCPKWTFGIKKEPVVRDDDFGDDSNGCVPVSRADGLCR